MNETNEAENNATAEAVAAKVANMAEGADPALRAARDEMDRLLMQVAKERDDAERREKYLRSECERLKAEVDELRRKLKPATVPQNDAGQVPCCSVCGGLGGSIQDADAPVPPHQPPGIAAVIGSARPCPGSGKPATWAAPEQPWMKATPIPSDKPAEPVAGVAQNGREEWPGKGFTVEAVVTRLCERVSDLEQSVAKLEDRLAQARREALGRDEVMSRELLVSQREVTARMEALEQRQQQVETLHGPVASAHGRLDALEHKSRTHQATLAHLGARFDGMVASADALEKGFDVFAERVKALEANSKNHGRGA